MPAPTITQIALVAVFAAVALLVGAVASLLLSRGDMGRRRLRQAVVTTMPTATIPELLPLTSDGALAGGWEDLAGLLPRSKKEMTRLRTRMLRAGVTYPGAPVLYSIA